MEVYTLSRGYQMGLQPNLELTVQQFVALESQVWHAFLAGDAESDARVLADNFLGVYATGFSSKTAHCDSLRAGPLALSYEICEPRILVISDDSVMLSYLAVWMRVNANPESKSERMYISSLWQRVEDSWKNVFSQDTPAC